MANQSDFVVSTSGYQTFLRQPSAQNKIENDTLDTSVVAVEHPDNTEEGKMRKQKEATNGKSLKQKSLSLSMSGDYRFNAPFQNRDKRQKRPGKLIVANTPLSSRFSIYSRVRSCF